MQFVSKFARRGFASSTGLLSVYSMTHPLNLHNNWLLWFLPLSSMHTMAWSKCFLGNASTSHSLPSLNASSQTLQLSPNHARHDQKAVVTDESYCPRKGRALCSGICWYICSSTPSMIWLTSSSSWFGVPTYYVIVLLWPQLRLLPSQFPIRTYLRTLLWMWLDLCEHKIAILREALNENENTKTVHCHASSCISGPNITPG